jgi:ribonuclease HI
MGKKSKYYVIWEGFTSGIVDSWEKCIPLIQGYKNAKYKSFMSLQDAKNALQLGWEYFYALKSQNNEVKPLPEKLFDHAICVDAACSGNPGVMEYRGVEPYTQAELFRKKFDIGTNNIGEFLAIVHGLAFIQKHNMPIDTLYSDSEIAIEWVEQKTIRSKMIRDNNTEVLWGTIDRALTWLHTHSYTIAVKKWQTNLWGENPADFGRKK